MWFSSGRWAGQVSLQFCPSISILILNQCGLKTYPLNWCFILNSQCSSCSASRHCETDVFSAVTNCCVYIFIVLAYDGPCSVFLPKDPGVWRECALSVLLVLVLLLRALFNCFTVHATSTFFPFFYPIWLNLADSHHTLPIRPRFMSVSLLYVLWKCLCVFRETLASASSHHMFYLSNFQSPRPPPPSDRITRQK